MPALKKWMNLRFGASLGEEGKALSVHRMVASSQGSGVMLSKAHCVELGYSYSSCRLLIGPMAGCLARN